MKHYLFVLSVQLLTCFLLSLIVLVLQPIRILSVALLWTVVPLYAMLSSARVVREALNPYIAWIAPPVALIIASCMVNMVYVPLAGIILFTALMSIFGAAAGDNLPNRKNRSK